MQYAYTHPSLRKKMRDDFSTFKCQFLKLGGGPPSASSSQTTASSKPATPVQQSVLKRFLQTFIPTKMLLPVDDSISRIASKTESPIGFLIPGRGARGIPMKDLLEGDADEKMAWGDRFFFHDVEYGEIDLCLSVNI